MNNYPWKTIAVTILLLLTFAAGRYSALLVAKTVESSATVKQEEKDKNLHINTTTTTVKAPDGTVKTITTTDTTSVSKTISQQESITMKEQVAVKRNAVNVSALIAYQYYQKKPTYGVFVSKEVIGPITTGLFGLTNGTVGLSIGINF